MFFRKQRRSTHDQSPTSPSSPSSKRSSTASSTLPSSLSKSFSRTMINADGDTVDDINTPYGLSLLHSPPEPPGPQIDFIFVHGLGGGSRKTWSKTPLRHHFWPQEWLPQDPAFKNVRILSYGYDTDYLKAKEDCLNIHHIGKSFLVALSTSPYLVDSRTHIVAVGHSMGGLVIKKAFILAKMDTAHKDLVGRFAAIYFLATPHRGADSARTLKNLLKVAYDRAYIADLERNSEAIQVINDEFRHFAAGLELWSFYETPSMRLFSSPIVDPESATLGYPEEKQVPMNADHRSICKFETPLDANYITVRNALASTVGNIVAGISALELKERRDRIKDLKKYLEAPDILDDDLLSVREDRMHDSCRWILAKPDYAKWSDGGPGIDRVLWIRGKPATGKSTLASYVIDHLREADQACSYFFFKFGDRSKSSLGRCLRSLAFQMASSNPEAGDTILEMQADGIRLDHVDERTLWRILFLSCIFPVTTTRHCWVIDALDECFDPSFLFDAIRLYVAETVPLRIIITSRDTAELDQGFSSIPPHMVRSLSVATADTLPDLKLLVERRTQCLGAVEQEDRASLAEKIVGKSKGSFLWTILVLKELANCYSKKEINQALEDVPRGMESLYKRTLDTMSQASRGKKLAKAILTWVACAIRPMTSDELNGALSLDIEDAFPRLEESISALCGQLVVVDKFGRLQMVHETAREFLLSDGLDSEFSVDKANAHTRMARACLVYFVGEEMKPPRTMNRRRSSAKTAKTRVDFAEYAYTAYSYHMSKADPTTAELFNLLGQFLGSNVLTWIEAIAESRDLNQIIRSSKHLKTYANACAAELSPLDPRMTMTALQQWTTDLARVPAMFANALTTSPSSIYSLIPPFCPTSSMIYKTTGPGRRLVVLGGSTQQWDDRLLCIDFRQGQPKGQPSALCYGDEFLAVGLAAGPVALYNAKSYQEYKVLDHGESVNFIAFRRKSSLMATCGMKSLKVWDIRSGEVVRDIESPRRPLDMAFDGDMLLVATDKSYVASWGPWGSAQDPLPEQPQFPTQRPWRNGPETVRSPPRGCPCALTLSTSHGMLAVAYSGYPITLWDMEEDDYVGSCGKKLPSGETSTHPAVVLAFNPNPNIGLLAVAYLDGDLALLDPFVDQQLNCVVPSGANGVIHVLEFDTFKLLYRVKSASSYIKQIGFARDSLRLADIRGAQCTVWEPKALLRDSVSDDSSGITSASIVETVSMEAKAKVTAMVVHPMAEVVFCGKDDGTVVLYSCLNATPLRTLYTHRSPIRLLAWCQRRDALLTVDAWNRIWLHRIQLWADQGPVDWETVLFQSRLDSEKAIVDVLVGDSTAKFIISTRESDHLFAMDSGEHERERACSGTPRYRKWIHHPLSSLHLICVDDNKVGVYCWADLSEVVSFSVSFSLFNGITQQLKGAALYSHGQEHQIILEVSERNSLANTSRIALLDASCLMLGSDMLGSQPTAYAAAASSLAATGKGKEKDDTAQCHPNTLLVPQPVVGSACKIAGIIGVTESGKFVFLDHSSWVCSANLSEHGLDEIFRHFFVPYDWFAGTKDIVCALRQRDILLTRGGDLAIIRSGFEHAERVLDE